MNSHWTSSPYWFMASRGCTKTRHAKIIIAKTEPPSSRVKPFILLAFWQEKDRPNKKMPAWNGAGTTQDRAKRREKSVGVPRMGQGTPDCDRAYRLRVPQMTPV
jgi:hypothetical protein